MSAKPNTWDAAADRELFLAVLSTQNISIDYDGVAKYLSKDGKVYTASSIMNRMTKLKKMVKGGSSAEDGEGTTPKSGRKRGAGAVDSPSKKPKTSKKGGKSTSDDGDDEETENKGVKQEDGGGDELS